MTKAFQTIYAAFIAEDSEFSVILLENWPCLRQDEKELLGILNGGSGGDGGGGPSTGVMPSWDDQEVTTLAATVQGDPITATGLSNTPTGRVDVYSPGGQHWRVGDGVKTKDIYFSGDGGTTAKAHTAIDSGDIPYLGTTGAAAGGVPSGEKISMSYAVPTAGGVLPSWADQEITTLAATVQGDPITATGLSNTPVGRVDTYSPGGQHWRIGDGVKTKDIYFSADGGTTARAHTAIVTGDIPYLGTTGAAAGGVPSGEKISICYTI